ncbi:MAG: Crp/Fnr family transcriptional regulator [Vicinamibacterales bacterium]
MRPPRFLRLEPWPDQSLFGKPETYVTGAVLFHQGDVLSTLYSIISGRVRLTVAQPGGREVLLGIRRTGWLLGASPAVLGCSHGASGTVIETSVLRPISHGTFRRANESDIAVTRWVQRALATDLFEHSIALAKFGGNSSARLGWYFAGLAATSAVPLADGSVRLSETPTQETIAQAIGITREHAGRLLDKFETEALLRRDKGRYIIPAGSRLFDLISADEDAVVSRRNRKP